MLQTNINYIAVLVAAILNMVIGAVWYSPLLFGVKWTALTGKSIDAISKRIAAQGYIGSALLSLVQAYVLAVILSYMQVTTIANGVIAAFFIWLGFIVTTSGSEYLFEGRSLNLFSLNTGYRLVSLLIMGGLLSVWR